MSLVMLKHNVEVLREVVKSYEIMKSKKVSEEKMKPLKEQILYLNVAIKKLIEENVES